MSLSVKTVSTYRTRVLEKMGRASNSDLTYYALKNSLIQWRARRRAAHAAAPAARDAVPPSARRWQ